MRIAACPWSTDASCMRAARLRNDYGHHDDRNSQCQSIIATELAVGVFISARGALSSDSDLAFFLGAGMAQC